MKKERNLIIVHLEHQKLLQIILSSSLKQVIFLKKHPTANAGLNTSVI